MDSVKMLHLVSQDVYTKADSSCGAQNTHSDFTVEFPLEIQQKILTIPITGYGVHK
jgi:hypothetical protein